MSKLIEKLRKVGQSDAAPMGFGFFGARTKAPPLLLLAGLPSRGGTGAQQAVADGADALLLDSDATPEQVKTALAAAGEAPVGVALAEVGTDEAAGLHTAGADFLVLTSLATPAGVLQSDGPAKVLEVNPDWSDAVLRTVEGLPVDGILVRLSGPFTLETWMRCLRVGGLARKTLLVALGGTVDTDALRSVRDAGATAVVVEPALVAAARRLIDTLPSPKRARERRDALLPALSRSVPAPPEEDEEE